MAFDRLRTSTLASSNETELIDRMEASTANAAIESTHSILSRVAGVAPERDSEEFNASLGALKRVRGGLKVGVIASRSPPMAKRIAKSRQSPVVPRCSTAHPSRLNCMDISRHVASI